MLFKTISASVYGIDAYPVEVEVDVGSAYMKDFNVVGLPDNAVKESREHIKSALRNCGFEFPYGQGVTINLAPADLRKEGSGFDLQMALGVVGCQGQFFGKMLDQMMFLGELSLDGSVRAVRGALSATIAAREAAVVDGIDVFALKSLPQAVDLVNSPESFHCVHVDAKQMLSEAAQYSVDLRDVHGQLAAKRALESGLVQVDTTFCLSGRQAPARPCWPSAFRQFCRHCRWKKPLRPREFIAWQAHWMATRD
jgi:magnesium chelatase family protein